MKVLLGTLVRGVGLVVGVTSTVLVSGPARADASSQPVSATRDASDPRWVQGQVSVAAPPDEVWAQLKHVDAWTKYFSDIKRFRVLSCAETSCKIQLETKTLSHGSLPYEVEFLEGRRMKVWTNEMGVKAVTYTTVRQGQTPNESNVVYSMFLEVSGAPSLLISEKSLRQKQEHMVTTTLEDMNKSFARR